MKTALEELQEYSDKLIRDGVSPEEYMNNIPVKIFGIFKSLKDKRDIESAYHEGFFDGRRWSDKQLGANVDLFYKNGHDYYIKTFKLDE